MKCRLPFPLLLLLVATTLHCQRTDKGPAPQAAVYYWETTTDWSFQWDSFAHAGISQLYLRLFDVVWDARAAAPVPAGPFAGYVSWPDSVPVVPVVFITNETLQQLDSAGCAELARKIDRKAGAVLDRLAAQVQRDAYWSTRWAENPPADEAIDSITVAARARWRRSIGELQIDCDWSVSTRGKFFFLLSELKRQAPQRRVSATIRLHQYRHPDKTGVPPVDRGMLMVYNVGNVRDLSTENSIFGYDAVRPYLDGAAPYPLPLDVALPAFEWGVLFHLGEFVAIVPPAVFKEYNSKFRPQGRRGYVATEDFTMNDHYVREGDVVRWEDVDAGELRRVVGLLRRQKLAEPLTVAFFHATASDDHAEQKRFFTDLLDAFR